MSHPHTPDSDPAYPIPRFSRKGIAAAVGTLAVGLGALNVLGNAAHSGESAAQLERIQKTYFPLQVIFDPNAPAAKRLITPGELQKAVTDPTPNGITITGVRPAPQEMVTATNPGLAASDFESYNALVALTAEQANSNQIVMYITPEIVAQLRAQAQNQ